MLELLALLGFERDETRGRLRRRLAELARTLEDLGDAELDAAMADGDIHEAA